jgi:protein-disulfide isomerase
MTHKEHAHHENATPNNTNLLLTIIVVLFTVIAAGAFYIGQNMNKSTVSQVSNTNQTITNNDTNNSQTTWLIIKVIDDVRCIDCNTDSLIENLKKVPALSSSTFNKVDFADEWVAEYLKENNIRVLPAVIFQTNFVAPGINEGLEAINETEFALDLWPTAKYNPFVKRSERGFLQLDVAELGKIKDNSYIQWNENAEITWIEYSDLECPFCARLHNSSTPKDVTTKYGDKLNVVFNHFPLSFHKNAQAGSEALECIGEVSWSDAFYSVLEKSYKIYDNNNFVLDGLFDIAAAEWVNKEALANCVESGKYTEKVQNQMTVGQSTFGVTGTPGNVLINNATGEYEVLSGAYPTPAFEAIIDKLLAK